MAPSPFSLRKNYPSSSSLWIIMLLSHFSHIFFFLAGVFVFSSKRNLGSSSFFNFPVGLPGLNFFDPPNAILSPPPYCEPPITPLFFPPFCKMRSPQRSIVCERRFHIFFFLLVASPALSPSPPNPIEFFSPGFIFE